MQFPPADPVEALSTIAPLSRLLYPAFEFATDKALAMVESEGLPADPHGFATVVRWHVKHRLDLAGHEAEFEREEVALLGLALTFGGDRYRIRKADEHGFLPPPGHSWRSRQFYAQQLAFAMGVDGTVQTIRRNFVILWHLQNGIFKELSLVLPRGSSEWVADWEWHVSIPYPTDQRATNLESAPAESALKTPSLGLRLRGRPAIPLERAG